MTQDTRKKQQNVAYQLKNEIRYKEKEIVDQANKIQVLEKENKTLLDRTLSLNDQVDNKAVMIDRTCQKLENTDRDIADI